MTTLDALRRSLYEDTRYEVARWPLWRWDQNLRYIAKSFAHRPLPLDDGDRDHHRAMRGYLAGLRWPAADGPTQRWAATGDLMWLRDGYDRFLSPSLQALFAQQDVLFANLETPIDPSAPVKRWVYETIRYNAPPSYLDVWGCAPDARKVFSLCNNHALDQGLEGLRATRAQVAASADRLPVGGPDPDHALAVFTRGDLRVAVIATTFGVNGAPPLAPPPGVPLYAFGDPRADTDWGELQRLIDAARAHDPDWVVMMPHWGFEYEYWPDRAMRADAARLLSMGVDIILGSSPHVLQPVEVASIDGWDAACPLQIARGGRPRAGIIAYSLGNFASIIPTVACQTGGVLRLSLTRAQITGLRFTPSVCRRGLGDRWLEARALTIPELRARPDARWRRSSDHAAAILGPLIDKEDL